MVSRSPTQHRRFTIAPVSMSDLTVRCSLSANANNALTPTRIESEIVADSPICLTVQPIASMSGKPLMNLLCLKSSAKSAFLC